MEKKNNSFMTFIIVILLLAVCAIGGYYLGGVKANENNPQVADTCEKCPEVTCQDDEKECVCPACNNEDKNYMVVNNNAGEAWYNLYAYYEADGQPITVIDYKGGLYLLSIYGDNSCVWEMDNNTLIFENNEASCQGDMPTYITRLNIKSSEIRKVIIANDLNTTDAQYRLFFIYKNGSVTESKYGEGSMTKTNRFPDLKVKDLKYYCSKPGSDGCSEKSFDLTLEDGSVKTVEY